MRQPGRRGQYLSRRVRGLPPWVSSLASPHEHGSTGPPSSCRWVGPGCQTLTMFASRRSAVGAGDTFIAGMLYGLTCHDDDWSMGQRVAFAVELATLKVQQEGFCGLAALARETGIPM